MKIGAYTLDGIGLAGTVIEMIKGKKKLVGEGGLDLIMGGVGFIPGGGWIVSGVYFGGKELLEYVGWDIWNH